MKLPYILLAESDPDHKRSFATIFEKKIAYADIVFMEDGKSLLSFLSGCGWKDLPDLIVLSFHLPDMNAPDLLRELLLNTRYLTIPKIIWMPAEAFTAEEECRMLGVKHFFKKTKDVFELETNVRGLEDLLKKELNF